MVKRILLIANEYTTIINFRMELLCALKKAGYEVAVALPDHKRNIEIKALGCILYSLTIDRKSKNPIKDFSVIYHISQILNQYCPDIVFTFTIKPNVYGGIACSLKKIPYVATITGLGSSIHNVGWMQKISLTLYKIGLKNAQKVFFQNTENRDFLIKKGIYKGNCAMIPGSGVNLKRFHLMEYPIEDTINFVFVGRVMKEKGIEEFFEMAIFIRNKYPNTRFHICGPVEGTYKDKLGELERNGIIAYHGMITDMTLIYSFTHCTVLPSYHEGMANVLLESAACGRPIITSNIAGCRETVDDGINGFLVDVNNSSYLIEKVEKFLCLDFNQRKQMGVAGRKKMEAEFDRNFVIETYLKELK